MIGRWVVVTRPRRQAGDLNRRLRRRGAVPVPYPCIDIAPPSDTAPLDKAVRDLGVGRFDWLLLTSANAVLAMRSRMRALGVSFGGAPAVAAVGPATATAARRMLGVAPLVVPTVFLADALASELPVRPGERVLLPQADLAGAGLAEVLAGRGAQVDRVEAYRTARGQGGDRLWPLLRAGRVDAVTITSASAARHLVGRVGAEGGRAHDLRATPIVCIGPRAAAAARRHGLCEPTAAGEHTLDGLVRALETALSKPRQRRRT